MPQLTPSAGYTLILSVELRNLPGTLGRLTTAIGDVGGDIEAIDIVGHGRGMIVRDISVKCRNTTHGDEIVAKVSEVSGVKVRGVSDRVFELHRGGKLAVAPKVAMRTRDDLAMAYTPGVARVSQAIAERPESAWEFTLRQNAVAVLTDGSAVLGLGNVGPAAALPVMEGKACLFKDFADIDAYPMCVDVSSPDELVAVGKAIAPGFGGINLEDVAAPACFEVEARLKAELDIPVFHDDQHGTAVVVLAALLNAARVVGKPLEKLTAVLVGAGAAGVACARLLTEAGVADVVACDRKGTIHAGRDDLDRWRRWLADETNATGRVGGIPEALAGADVLIGVSGPGVVKPEWVTSMSDAAIVFALANPVPEIMPEEMPGNVAVVATGRSDYANQINNVLAFPGIFRGLLDTRAAGIDLETEIAAARAIADLVGSEDRAADFIIPSPFSADVVPAVAAAVRGAATGAGLARRPAEEVARPSG